MGLMIWTLVGAYLELPLILGEGYIPGIMLVLAAPVMAVLVRRDIERRDLLFFASLASLAVVSIIFSPGLEFLSAKLKGAVQLLFSCGLMMLLVKASRRINAAVLYWCFVVAALVIGSGLLLEFFVPAVKDLNDDARERLYSAGDSGFGYAIYENTERDEAMVGRDRATFFTTEPSAAAEGIMVFSICCLILRQDSLTIAVFAYANFCAFLTTGSPVIPLSMAAGFIALVRFNLLRKPVVLILGASLMILTLAVPGVREVLSKQTERLIDGIDEYGDLSIFSRVGVPYFRALPTVAAKSPVFGVGVGGKEILDAWRTDNLRWGSLEFAVGTNAFVLVFLYFGLVGGSIYYWLFYRYFKAIGIRYLVLFAIVWAAYGNTTGALESPRFWAYTGFLVSAFWYRSQRTVSTRGKLIQAPLLELGSCIEPAAPTVI